MSKVYRGGARTIAGIVAFSGGMRQIMQGQVRSGGTWRTFFVQAGPAPAPPPPAPAPPPPAPAPTPSPAPPPPPPPAMTVSASPPSYFRSASSTSIAGSSSVNFNAIVANAIGAVTYSWSLVARTAEAFSASGFDTSTLNLTASWARHSTHEWSDQWRITATDSTGQVATADITDHVIVGDNT